MRPVMLIKGEFGTVVPDVSIVGELREWWARGPRYRIQMLTHLSLSFRMGSKE